MYVGLARYDFVVPGSNSLKDKRQVVKRIIGGARKFNVAIAEVDHQELWRRAAIAVSCVSGSSFHAKKVLLEVERYVRGHLEIEVLDSYTEVMVPDA